MWGLLEEGEYGDLQVALCWSLVRSLLVSRAVDGEEKQWLQELWRLWPGAPLRDLK